jgi:hypothetical protein
LAAAVLLVAADFSTISFRTIGIGACSDRVDPGVCRTAGHDSHSYVLVAVGLVGLVMAWGAVVGRSRAAGVAVAALGVVVLFIALAVDLPKLDDKRGLEVRYNDVSAHTGTAFKLELAGGVLLLLAGGLALVRAGSEGKAWQPRRRRRGGGDGAGAGAGEPGGSGAQARARERARRRAARAGSSTPGATGPAASTAAASPAAGAPEMPAPDPPASQIPAPEPPTASAPEPPQIPAPEPPDPHTVVADPPAEAGSAAAPDPDTTAAPPEPDAVGAPPDASAPGPTAAPSDSPDPGSAAHDLEGPGALDPEAYRRPSPEPEPPARG